jgi:hypothetical protein
MFQPCCRKGACLDIPNAADQSFAAVVRRPLGDTKRMRNIAPMESDPVCHLLSIRHGHALVDKVASSVPDNGVNPAVLLAFDCLDLWIWRRCNFCASAQEKPLEQA